MLTSLSIKNYALIDNLKVDFSNGLSIITGETGAGKSILLGGISLVLGKRADLSSIKNKSEKCVIEAEFDLRNYNLKPIFIENNLDFETQTIIRREILPSGKSRAFVNDTPVNLDALQTLSIYLIDIHSQHETLKLTNNQFQFKVIDALATNQEILDRYSEKLNELKEIQDKLEQLQTHKSEAIKEHDYNLFLLNELNDANLVEGELEQLEQEYETLSNVEEIKTSLSNASQLLNSEEIGILSALTELKSTFQGLSRISKSHDELYQRIESCQIDLDDIYNEIEQLQNDLQADPSRLEQVNSKLTRIHNLLLKHNAEDISELLDIKTDLESKVTITENIDGKIQEIEETISILNNKLITQADQLHKNRSKAIPVLVKELQELSRKLGLPNAQFKLELNKNDKFFTNGSDELKFLFSANKGSDLNTLKKTASGGELSRIMLAVKYILSKHIQLPTIMFDEIDSGVSGEIANSIGHIMQQMSRTMQVFTITHLPQIAAKGDDHFKVYKEDLENKSITKLIKLKENDRIVEIAQMLGGEKPTDSAVLHAKSLLQ